MSCILHSEPPSNPDRPQHSHARSIYFAVSDILCVADQPAVFEVAEGVEAAQLATHVVVGALQA